MKYNLFKLFHIIGIVTWLGPSSGGFLLIFLSRLSKHGEVEMWLRQEYLSLIYVETAGLFIIILSGLGMLISSKWVLYTQLWLIVKRFIVILIFIPLELIQLYLYHEHLKKAFASGVGIQETILLFDRFCVIAFILLAITVPVVLIMGILKPIRKIT
ncbi:MAG TPA: hypothetical protein ENH82_16905 [bacterium]|nr:hypothetical protein [bacterium]